MNYQLSISDYFDNLLIGCTIFKKRNISEFSDNNLSALLTPLYYSKQNNIAFELIISSFVENLL